MIFFLQRIKEMKECRNYRSMTLEEHADKVLIKVSLRDSTHIARLRDWTVLFLPASLDDGYDVRCA